jgi:hypothetical protein
MVQLLILSMDPGAKGFDFFLLVYKSRDIFNDHNDIPFTIMYKQPCRKT